MGGGSRRDGGKGRGSDRVVAITAQVHKFTEGEGELMNGGGCGIKHAMK
jgi:hypothetical protein